MSPDTKHAPALPLYTSADAARALSQLQRVGYDRAVAVWGRTGVGLGSDWGRIGVGLGSDPNLTPNVEFINAGHVLGSAYARVRAAGKTIVFGGDLGRDCQRRGEARWKTDHPIIRDRTRRRGSLLAETTRGRPAHSGAAGVESFQPVENLFDASDRE